MALPTGCPRLQLALRRPSSPLQPALRRSSRPVLHQHHLLALLLQLLQHLLLALLHWLLPLCSHIPVATSAPFASTRVDPPDPANRASSRAAACGDASTPGDQIPDRVLATAHSMLQLLCDVVITGFSTARQLSCRLGRPKLAGGDERRIQGAHG